MTVSQVPQLDDPIALRESNSQRQSSSNATVHSHAPSPAPQRTQAPTPQVSTAPTPALRQSLSAAQSYVNRQQLEASNRERRRAEAQQDRVIIDAVKKGDKKAFETLVQRHERGAFGLAYSYVRDRNDAKEITQEAFLRAYRGLPRFEGGSSFYTWLYRIVTNLCIDFLRRPHQRQAEWQDNRKVEQPSDARLLPLVAPLDGANPIRVLRRKEIADRLQQALAALPPYHLDVILWREIDGMSYIEMAQAAGVSKGTIMSRLYHARQKLQTALKDCYELEYGPVDGLGSEGATAKSKQNETKSDSDEDGSDDTSTDENDNEDDCEDDSANDDVWILNDARETPL